MVAEVTCRELSALVSVVAGAVAETPAAPPASLPDTDAGTEAGGTNWEFWGLLAAGGLIGLGGLAAAWRRINA